MEQNVLRKLEFIASKIANLEGVVDSKVVEGPRAGIVNHRGYEIGVIEATVAGPNKELKKHIVEMCARAMAPIKVSYQIEDKLMTEAQLQEMGQFSPVMSLGGGTSGPTPTSCDTYSRDMIDFLNVQGPIGSHVSDKSQPVTVPGFATEPPDAPADEIAGPVDGAEKLKRIRSSSRGRPVVGWRIGDMTLRVGSQLRVTGDCYVPWQQGRNIGLRAGMVLDIGELSSRYPIVYASIGDYTGLEVPVHSLGRTMELVGHDKKEEKEAGYDNVLRFEGVHSTHSPQVECTADCGCDGPPAGDDLVSPKKKPFKKKK